MKKLTIFLLGVFLVFGLAANAGGVLLTWTDDEGKYMPSWEGNTTEYALSFDDPDYPGFENASFRISTLFDISSDARVGWIAFKFSPKGGDITSDISASDGSWTVGGDSTLLPWGPPGTGGDISPFADDGWAGFYANSLSTDGDTGGFLLTGVTDITFTFDFAVPSLPLLSPEAFWDFIIEEGVSLKIGFYGEPVNSHNPKIQTDQLSEHLVVPEPATMLLMGCGLLGLSVVGRKKFFKRV